MKHRVAGCFALLLLGQQHGAQATKAMTFGPRHCVSVSKNDDTGSCILETNCQGVDLSAVVFAFTCKSGNRVTEHNFGNGGFDQMESFDTSIKCDSCGLPKEVTRSQNVQKKPRADRKIQMRNARKMIMSKKKKTATGFLRGQVVPKPRTLIAAHMQQQKVMRSRQHTGRASENRVSYGPSGCIEAWMQSGGTTPTAAATPTEDAGSAPTEEATGTEEEATQFLQDDGNEGTCYIQTKCKDVEASTFAEYNVGLICVDKGGIPTRHLFGKNSFDREEQFNTMIKCNVCLGLDETSESVELENTVKSLSKQLFSLKEDVVTLTKQVGSVETMVSSEQAKYAQAAEAQAAAAAASAAAVASNTEESTDAGSEEETTESDEAATSDASSENSSE